jgi:hypothetical protein
VSVGWRIAKTIVSIVSVSSERAQIRGATLAALEAETNLQRASRASENGVKLCLLAARTHLGQVKGRGQVARTRRASQPMDEKSS